MMPFLKRSIWSAIFVTSLVGCGGGGGSSDASRRPTLAFADAVTDVDAVEFRLNSNLQGSPVALGTVTAFDSKDAADYDASVRESGGVEDLWAESVVLANNSDSVLVSLGLRNYGDETLKRVQLLRVPIDRTVPNGTKARLVVVHAFNRAAGLDTPAIDFQVAGDNPAFRLANVGYATQQTAEVDAGTQTYQARRNGTGLVYAEKELNLAAGGIYLVLITGVEGGTGSQAPSIRLIPLAPRR